MENCSFEPRKAVRSGDGYGEVHYVILSTLLPLWNFQYENIEKKNKKDFDFKRLSSMIFISKHQKVVRQHGWVFPYQLEKWRAPFMGEGHSSSTIHDPIFTTRTPQEDGWSFLCVVPSLNNASLSGDKTTCICSWCFRNKIIKNLLLS